MSNSFQNSLNATTVSNNFVIKDKQLDNQKKTYKKEDLKILQQKYSNSMSIPNPTQKQLLYLQQQLQQQRIQQQQQQLQQQLKQQQQQMIYNKIQNKRKIDREKMLDTYIYDYCLKRNYKQTAELLKQEAKVSVEDIQQINSEGFLYEWWTVFWEIYSAKENNEEDTTSDALTYIGAQNLKAKQNEILLRQINSINTPKGVNSSSLTNQIMNPQLKQLQQLQLQQLHSKQNAQSSNITQASISTTQPSTTQSSIQQQLQQLQAQIKSSQTQNQSHSNSSSSILANNQNHTTTLNNSNSILPLTVTSNSTSGAAKNLQLSTSDSPQFNISNALTGLTYTPQSLPNSSRASLIQSNNIAQSQQPTQSPHLSTNPSPQLSQGILRNGTNTSSLSNASNLQNIGRSSAATATLNLYAAMRNQSNLSLQDKNQLLSQSHIMKMVQNKVLNQIKQQKNGSNQTISTSTVNTPTSITTQTSGIKNASTLKKNALSPTDSVQEMSPPPSKRIRANSVQYSPVLNSNTIQSPVLTTQQQSLNINTSPIISNNGLLSDLSTTQLMGKNWNTSNKQLINQQLQNPQNQLLLKRKQQLGLQNTEAQELLLQQKALQAQAQGLKTANAQIQYNLKLKAQQSQNQILSTNPVNIAVTSSSTVNFKSLKAGKSNITQKNKITPIVTTLPTAINKLDSNSIIVKSSPSSISSDIKHKTSVSPNQDSSVAAIATAKATTVNNESYISEDNEPNTQKTKNVIGTTSQSLTQIKSNIDKKDPNNLNQLSLSLLQNPSTDTLDQILQNSSINYSLNDADMFNKSMEILLNFHNLAPFDGDPTKNEIEKANSNAIFDSVASFANDKTANVDEDPEKMFSIPVESVFYGTGSSEVKFPTEKKNNSTKKKLNLNYIGNKNLDVNKVKFLTPITSLQEHKQTVSACCFDNLGVVLASGSNDNKTIIWDVSNTNNRPKPVWTLGGHKKSVNIVRFFNLTGLVGNAVTSNNVEQIINTVPTLLVTGSIDKTVRIWKLNGIKNGIINEKESYEIFSVFEKHNWNITAADFCPVAVCSSQNVDGFGEPGKKVTIYCGSLDAEGELKIWNIINKKILKSIKLNKSSKFDYLSNPLRFRPINNGSFFISDSSIVTIVAAYATSLIVIDFILPIQNNANDDGTDDYTIRTKQTDHKKYISTIEWSSDGNNLITASEDMIYVWNIDSNNEFQVIYSIPSDNEKITSCIFLPNPFLSSVDQLNTKSISIAYSVYNNIYVWESEKNSSTLYSQYSPSVGKISSYNKAHTGTICSLSSCIRLKPTVKAINENTTSNDIEYILASSSNTKENNLKIWNINI
ncbi:WD40 repeat-like protein [Piromyces finnis]|uniref:WD40 repeat-like protein n=1 Tax=Piromyces finnis TaxID=1754191 RepID=A0A1Y1VIV9_9FUNG|nr:WD40 repeat-like protein [Piromyces finnis]|eukprot:ORX56032.1 WD40 repeat-like protein [Piromyces finnis]